MLKLKTRKPGINLKKEREQGNLPGIIYGHGFKNIAFFVDYHDFINEIKKHGESALLNVKIDNQKKFKVLLQDYQKNPVQRTFTHIDFYRIKMDQELHTQIPLHFVGEFPAQKADGILVKNRDYVEVKCLPNDLVSEIEVPLESLKEIHDSISLKEIKIPKGIKILDDKDLVLATIAPPVEEEEEVTAEEEEAAIEALRAEGEEAAEEGQEKAGAKEDSKESDQKKPAKE